jgi:hypothetical protein
MKKEKSYPKYTIVHYKRQGSEVVRPGPRYPGGWQAGREKYWNSRQKRGKNVSATGKKVAGMAGRTDKVMGDGLEKWT